MTTAEKSILWCSSRAFIYAQLFLLMFFQISEGIAQPWSWPIDPARLQERSPLLSPTPDTSLSRSITRVYPYIAIHGSGLSHIGDNGRLYNIDRFSLEGWVRSSSAAEKPEALTAAYRAGLIEENAEQPQFPKISTGKVVWSVEKPELPQNSDILASVNIPSFDLSATIRFSRITVKAGETTTGIHIFINKGKKSPLVGALTIGRLQLRATGADVGNPLPISDEKKGPYEARFTLSLERRDQFLFIKSLATGQWFDFAINDERGRTLVLTFERGKIGEFALARPFQDGQQ